jgi:hypothetical protein
MNMITNTTISFRIPLPFKQQIESYAKNNLLSVSDICRQLLIAEMKRERNTN